MRDLVASCLLLDGLTNRPIFYIYQLFAEVNAHLVLLRRIDILGRDMICVTLADLHISRQLIRRNYIENVEVIFGLVANSSYKI